MGADATLTLDDLFTVLVCSMRYAMGRMSYVVSDVASLMKRKAGLLPQHQTDLIVSEIRAELVRVELAGRTLGFPADHEEWRGVVYHLTGKWPEPQTPTPGASDA